MRNFLTSSTSLGSPEKPGAYSPTSFRSLVKTVKIILSMHAQMFLKCVHIELDNAPFVKLAVKYLGEWN